MGDVYETNRWIFTAYEFPFFVVHLSVAMFLSAQIWKRNKTFSTAFYYLYLQQTAVKYIGYVVTLLDRFYPNQDASTIDYAMRRAVLGFAIGFIFLGDTTIAFNRLTALLFPTHHKKIWTGGRLMAILITLHTVAFLYGTSRQLIALGFVAAEGQDLKTAMSTAGKYHSYISAISNIVSFATNAVLESITFVYFQRLTASLKKKNRNNFQLLLYAITNELLQLCVAVYFFNNVLGWKDSIIFHVADTYLAYCRYAQWFSSAVFLLITSQSVRDAYLAFYGRGTIKTGASLIFSQATSSVAGQQPAIRISQAEAR